MNEWFKKVKVEDLTNSRLYDVVQLYHDYWWVVTEDNCVLFYRGNSPQCNPNKELCESFLRKHPECHCEQIPLAFVKWNTGECCG